MDHETVISDKFRTTPIPETITKITGLPTSAILYKCAASSYWQFRVFLEGAQRKRSTKQVELLKAKDAAKVIYAEMLLSVHAGQSKAKPSSAKTLQLIANSLWTTNETRIKNGELHKDKVSKDKYVYDRHIKPFFANTDVKKIDTDMLDDFKTYLANKDLQPGTQLSYINLVMSLLKQAQIKKHITHIPLKPNVRVDDEARGYFDDADYEKLIKTAKAAVGQQYEFKSKDGNVYRRITITAELPLLIDFMVNTYVRPTDIAVLRYKHVHEVEQQGIKFIELRHPATKRHSNHMLGSEQSFLSYSMVKSYQAKRGTAEDQDFVFAPDLENRETALDMLASQFTAILEMAKLRQDDEGKPRTMYSLRHTAIVRSIHKGLPIEMIAANSRTSSDMIRRFYGSHVKSVRHMGTAFVDKEVVAREQRIEQLKAKYDFTLPPPESLDEE
jgi:integrase